ncbi:MAG TPA: hypothetical protein VMG12_20640 [Polyangiaceae bacterium]|nr:hypothetical protein [Polyangiaceae bacterium]
MIPRSFCRHAGLFVASLGAPAVAAEAPPIEAESNESERRGSHGGHHYNDILSVRVAYVEALDEVEAEREGEAVAEGHPLTRHSAVGLGLEHTLVPGLLNAHVGALLFFGAEGAEMPTSLLFEMPWELSEAIEVYAGAGLAADLVREDRLAPSFGLASAAGVYAWATHELGANVDIEHRWVPSEHRIYDLTLAIGASARF